MFDPAKVKADFPIFGNNPDLIYLDNAATSHKPEVVIEAMNEFYRTENANTRRSFSQLGEQATERFESVRAQVARFINAADSSEVAFVRGTTEALNVVANGLTRELKAGDVVVLTEMEHHANLVPWYLAAERQQFEIRFVKITDDGQLDRVDLTQKLIGAKVLSLTHVSNVLGTTNPIAEIAEEAHQAGVTVVVDAAQSVPNMPVSVQDLGADFIAFSGHKMLGPTGIGILWGKDLAGLPPLIGGGQMISEVELGSAEYIDPPHRFEAGTMPIAEVVGLGAAIGYLEKLGMENVRSHEQELTSYALKQIGSLEGIRVFGPSDAAERGGIIAFSTEHVHPHDLATILDQDGSAIRSGGHCAHPLHKALGVSATARVSFSVYNGPADVDRLVASIKKAQKTFATPVSS